MKTYRSLRECGKDKGNKKMTLIWKIKGSLACLFVWAVAHSSRWTACRKVRWRAENPEGECPPGSAPQKQDSGLYAGSGIAISVPADTQKAGWVWSWSAGALFACCLWDKKHDKLPSLKHFFLPLLCTILDARLLPFIPLLSGLGGNSCTNPAGRH
jgi:hypothetical protein